jgi:hypothetical protein
MASALWVVGYAIGVAFSLACLFGVFGLLRSLRSGARTVVAASRVEQTPAVAPAALPRRARRAA